MYHSDGALGRFSVGQGGQKGQIYSIKHSSIYSPTVNRPKNAKQTLITSQS